MFIHNFCLGTENIIGNFINVIWIIMHKIKDYWSEIICYLSLVVIWEIWSNMSSIMVNYWQKSSLLLLMFEMNTKLSVKWHVLNLYEH